MAITCRVLLVSGSLRSGSTNTALLRTAQAVAPEGVVIAFYQGADDLPHFNLTSIVIPSTRRRGVEDGDSLCRRPPDLDTGVRRSVAGHAQERLGVDRW